jgi:hypothetical protein
VVSNGFAILSLSLIAMSLLSVQAAAQTSLGVRVSFSTDSDVVLHQPVLVQLTIENQLPEPIQVDLGYDRLGNIRMDVRRPDGSRVQPIRPTNLDSGGGMSRIGEISVAVGQAFTQQILVDEWLRLDRPGDYQLIVGVNTPIRTASGKVVSSPTTQTLDVHVGARDEARLREVCQRLAQIAVTAPTYEAKANAAAALARVSAPEAIDSIAAVIDASTQVDEFMVQGLERIGTSSARSVLLKMAASARSDRAKLAGSAIKRFRLREQ